MKVYFDTNLYTFITERGEARQVHERLMRRHAVLTGSDENLSELYRTVDVERRRSLFRTLGELHPRRLQPVGFLHAKELAGEIKRLHPEWLKRNADHASTTHWLNAARKRWPGGDERA